MSVNGIRLGKKIPPFIVGFCGFTNYYGLPFLYLISRDIVLHENPEANEEAKRFAIVNILWSLPLFTAPVAMYRVAKRILNHYAERHEASRGDPESDEIDTYCGAYSIPLGGNLQLQKAYYREVPREDFWGGKPWLVLWCLPLPFLTIAFLPSFYYQAQRSLNHHWEFHKRMAGSKKS